MLHILFSTAPHRYFVLDSGYLTYYVDQSDQPPYGKDKKGQICLAGYRAVHTGRTHGSTGTVFLTEDDLTGAGAASAANSSTKQRQPSLKPSRKSFGSDEDTPAEDNHRIQLLLMDTSFQVTPPL